MKTNTKSLFSEEKKSTVKRKSNKITLATKNDLYNRIPSSLNNNEVALFILDYYIHFQKNIIDLNKLYDKFKGIDVNNILEQLTICENTIRPFLYYSTLKEGYQVTT
jgi:hypothetical protein